MQLRLLFYNKRKRKNNCKKNFSFIQEQELTCDSAMTAGSLLPHDSLCSSPPHRWRRTDQRKIPRKQNGKNKAQTSSFACTGKFLSKRKGKKIKNCFSVWISSNPERIPGDNSTAHEVLKNQALLGWCSSSLLPFLSICFPRSVSSLLERG